MHTRSMCSAIAIAISYDTHHMYKMPQNVKPFIEHSNNATQCNRAQMHKQWRIQMINKTQLFPSSKLPYIGADFSTCWSIQLTIFVWIFVLHQIHLTHAYFSFCTSAQTCLVIWFSQLSTNSSCKIIFEIGDNNNMVCLCCNREC